VKKKSSPKGVVALLTILILAGVGVLGIAMVVTSQLNTAAANNYRYKIQTYNAADGVMTLIAQEILDFQDSAYLGKRPYCDIGNPLKVPGRSACNKAKGYDTIIGSGGLHPDKSDKFHFSYSPIYGDCEMLGKLEVHKSGGVTRGRTGLMIRQDLTDSARYALTSFCFRSTDSLRFMSRRGRADSSAERACTSYTNFASNGVWLKLSKSGQLFNSYYSSDGTTWNLLGSEIINMTYPVYGGIIIGSGATTTTFDTVIYSNVRGIPVVDSIKIGKDSIPVMYTLAKLDKNIFSASTEGYKLKGNLSGHNYITRLNQNLVREDSGAWHFTALDTALVPVTFYDYRSDNSNPEFNIRAEINYPSGTNAQAHFVKDTLDSIRKPILKLPVTSADSAFRKHILKCYDSVFASMGTWYTTMSEPQRFKRGVQTFPDTCKNNAYTANGNKSTWIFCDSLVRWFRPWGDYPPQSYSFDTLTGKWGGLQLRPGYESEGGWVGLNWDSTQNFANVVFYDTLKFRQNDPTIDPLDIDTTLFTFGKKYWATGADSKWFVSGCGGADFPAGTYRFLPIKSKGFRDDFRVPTGGTQKNNACKKTQNFSFGMEIHRKFTYKPGQIFKFRGDDDTWVYINNKLVVDIGGTHAKDSATVNLSSLGLVSGNEYWFDMFYCERAVWESNILITTNMMLWIPPQPLKRSWKRDYGNLD
jgi:fibro-slime domain-containing protein